MMEGWLSSYEHLLLLQRIQVQLPVLCRVAKPPVNPVPGFPDPVILLLVTSGTYAHAHVHRNMQIHFLKKTWSGILFPLSWVLMALRVIRFVRMVDWIFLVTMISTFLFSWVPSQTRSLHSTPGTAASLCSSSGKSLSGVLLFLISVKCGFKFQTMGEEEQGGGTSTPADPTKLDEAGNIECLWRHVCAHQAGPLTPAGVVQLGHLSRMWQWECASL